MVEHLTREQIAALLDEPDAMPEGLAHLDGCAECASEFEAMSRTRMALSAMPDLQAPEGAWETIRAALPDREEDVRPKRPWLDRHGPWGPLLAAAAILVLFLGGLGVGRLLVPGGAGEGSRTTASEPGASELEDRSLAGADEDAEYARTVAELRELRATGPSSEEIAGDPALAAERLTRLDALIEVSREALRTAPADPALNDFLFDVVDERESVADQLGATIHQASMEY